MGRRGGSILALLFALASCGAPEPRHELRLVLLLTVDTLRADRLGAYGSDRGLTPHIDRLARDSLVFTTAYAPSSHTLPSIATLLTGRYPEELGVWGNRSVLPANTRTLAGTFRAAGWHTGAVVSNWVVRGATGLAAGFHRYDDSLPQWEAGRALPERIAADTTDAALAELDACLPDAGARCFLWVHYQDPHGPYTPPGDRRARYLERERAVQDGRRELPALPGPFGSGGIPTYQLLDGVTEVAFYRAGYDAEVAYLDEEVGRLLEGLAARGLLETSLVVFTADHGESLGEDDYWFGHGERLSDPLVRVPLLVRAPGAGSGPRPDLAALVDVFPTLTQAALGSTPEPDRAGRALLAEGAEAGASVPYLAVLLGAKVHRFGVVDGDFKYLAELRGDVWNGRLLQRDDESVDLTAPAPHVAAAMRNKLEQLHQRYHLVDRESRAELSPQDREKLKALGYADPAGPRARTSE